MRNPSVLVLALLAGAAGGFLLAQILRAPRHDMTPGIANDSRSAAAPATHIQEPIAPPAQTAKEQVTREIDPGLSGAPDEGEVFGPVQRGYGAKEIALGWLAVRRDQIPPGEVQEGLQRYEIMVRSGPRQIGRDLANRQTERDVATNELDRAGLFAVLAALDAGGLGPLPEVVSDAHKYAAQFTCQSLGPSMSVKVFAEIRDVPGAVQIVLPPGVTKLSEWPGDPRNWPACVTITGSGMQASLLVADEIHIRGPVDRLTIRDCTIKTNDDCLTDLRHKYATILMERVRVIGFDTGSGASCAFSTAGSAMLLRDCRFEGGYGRSPETGSLMDIRTQANLMRFERCVFERMSMDLERLPPGATIVFDTCRMIDLLDEEDPRALGHKGIQFLGGEVYLASEATKQALARDLDLLFPGWKQAQ